MADPDSAVEVQGTVARRGAVNGSDPDAIVDMSRKIEMHMPSDRPGLIMRKRLMALLTEHGEREIPRSP